MATECTERVTSGGHANVNGGWDGGTKNRCGLTLDEHDVLGEKPHERRVHVDNATGHSWTTCHSAKHDGDGVHCWCRRRPVRGSS